MITQAKAIFQGEKGYAFETISPENGLILMHAEDDLSTLKTVEYADVEEKEDFKGVSDFTVESLTLNVVDTAQAAFFTTIFLAKNCLCLSTLKSRRS